MLFSIYGGLGAYPSNGQILLAKKGKSERSGALGPRLENRRAGKAGNQSSLCTRKANA
jgi:hypothetical protein